MITFGSFVFEMKVVHTEISFALYSRSWIWPLAVHVEAVALSLEPKALEHVAPA